MAGFGHAVNLTCSFTHGVLTQTAPHMERSEVLGGQGANKEMETPKLNFLVDATSLLYSSHA